MLAIAGANLAQGRWFARWEHDHRRRLLYETARPLRRYQPDTSPRRVAKRPARLLHRATAAHLVDTTQPSARFLGYKRYRSRLCKFAHAWV